MTLKKDTLTPLKQPLPMTTLNTDHDSMTTTEAPELKSALPARRGIPAGEGQEIPMNEINCDKVAPSFPFPSHGGRGGEMSALSSDLFWTGSSFNRGSSFTYRGFAAFEGPCEWFFPLASFTSLA